MSYQVLALKYRPRNFETLVGQEHVVRALTHALEQGRLHHAYLFTGTRGVGKTSLARILAKSFNCEGPDGQGGVTASPCGQCDACRAIDAGRFVDYIEMDAASNRGVDEMAQLLEQAVYAPSNARFKVYMIDEVHMLTNHAFNAMLKTLEEPPPHVKFILATTDPQKIPVTVLSRCLQFNLKQMPPSSVVTHLEDILEREEIGFELAALRLLAQGAQGSMRDALSLTDQAIAYAAGTITLEAVQGMLGTLDQSYLVRLLDALAVKDGAGLLAVADELASRSLSYSAALQDLGVLLHRIALAQTVPAALPDDLPEREDILRLATVFNPEEVQLFYQIATHGRHELGLAPDEYAGFSMTLLRMLAFRPGMGAADALPASLPGASAQATAVPTAPRTVSAAKPAPSNVAVPPASRQAEGAGAKPIPAPTPAASQEDPAARNLSPAMAALEAARAGGRRVREAGSPTGTPSAPPAAAAAPTSPQPTSTTSATPPWEEDIPWDDGAAGNDSAWQDQPAQKKSSQSVGVRLRRQEESEVAVLAPISAAAEAAPWPSPRQEPKPLLHVPFPTENQATGPQAQVAEAAAPSTAFGARVQRPVSHPEQAAVEAADLPSWTPVPALKWDGNWPTLAAGLPLRGVVQQLAQQSELISCTQDGNDFAFVLQVPLNTLCSPASVGKLTDCLAEHFSQPLRVDTRIGPVRHTAHAAAMAEQARRQKEAERTMQEDPFVQTLIREFGATIVPGSIRPV